MGTKNKPGRFDCYAKAGDDEPMFVLLGRDPVAGFVVRLWILLRERIGKQDEAVDSEALLCSQEMTLHAINMGKKDLVVGAGKLYEDMQDVRAMRKLLRRARTVSGLNDLATDEDAMLALEQLPVNRDALEQKLAQREARIFAVCNEMDVADAAIRREVSAGVTESTLEAVKRCAADANKASEILSRLRLFLGAGDDEDTLPALQRVLEETKEKAIKQTSKQEIR